MSEFRTELKEVPSGLRMGISDRIFTIGSCFSDAIGKRMAESKLEAFVNPAGVLYSPAAIHRLLDLALSRGEPDPDQYCQGERFFHYDFHSSLAAESQEALSRKLMELIVQCGDQLDRSTWLIITYGTAWVYRRRDNGEIVANCHKQPSSKFDRSLLSPDDVVASFKAMYERLQASHPALQIILTVSPVRHVKDTLEGNSLSKSVLRVACDNVVRLFPNVSYFPAYEIMMDDLRDYRFYKSDMIHPSDVAEEYLWEKFGYRWFDESLLAFIQSWKSILQALRHRPFHPGTKAHRRFLENTLKRVADCSGFANVEAERQALLEQLAQLPASMGE